MTTSTIFLKKSILSFWCLLAQNIIVNLMTFQHKKTEKKYLSIKDDADLKLEVKMYEILIYLCNFWWSFPLFCPMYDNSCLNYFSPILVRVNVSWEAMPFTFPFHYAFNFSLSVNGLLCLFKWSVFRGDTGLHPENDCWHFTDIH